MKEKLKSVYKKDGKLLKVNENSFKYIKELGLSSKKPKSE